MSSGANVKNTLGQPKNCTIAIIVHMATFLSAGEPIIFPPFTFRREFIIFNVHLASFPWGFFILSSKLSLNFEHVNV